MCSMINSGEPGRAFSPCHQCPDVKKYTQDRKTQTQKMHQVSIHPLVFQAGCWIVQSRKCFDFQTHSFFFFLFYFISPPLPLFWEMRKIYKSKLLIKHLLCPWDRGPSVLFRWHVYCWHLSFLWVCTEPWNPFTFLIRLFLFFSLVQENRICNMHNTLKKTCSIRGKALPMFLATCTSKGHNVKKNSTRGLRKVLVFCILGHICLRQLPYFSDLTFEVKPIIKTGGNLICFRTNSTP